MRGRLSLRSNGKISKTLFDLLQRYHNIIIYMYRSIIADALNINRTGKQCRERYNNHLNPNIKKGDWCEEEDQMLMRMNELYGNKWTKIAQFLPGRSG